MVLKVCHLCVVLVGVFLLTPFLSLLEWRVSHLVEVLENLNLCYRLNLTWVLLLKLNLKVLVQNETAKEIQYPSVVEQKI